MTQWRLPDIDAIREALRASGRGPLKAKELARALDVPTAGYREFRRALKGMESAGEIYRNRKDRYAVPDSIHLVVGGLRRTRAGDGFVKPDASGDPDVFVGQRHLESAMDGDRVAVRVESRPRGRAPEGRVVKVLARARPTIVGRYHSSRRFGFVTPLDRRVHRDVLIADGSEGGASEGDIVVVRILQYGTAKRNATGEVETVLGPMEDPGVDVLAVLHGHGLTPDFPPDVEAAAEAAAALLDRPGKREDLRDLVVFTIDPTDARDHDDALSLIRLEDGLVEVGIHIADVSHFVAEGSPLDAEALHRGTSIYLVDQVVPMLPHRLSSDLCSLKVGEDRLALSLLVRLDRQGHVRSHRFARTWIRSRHGLDYQTVQKVLDGEATADPELDETLRALDAIAAKLRERRRARGSLDFDLPEARVVLDEEGIPTDIQRTIQLDSHRLIEDFMLLANEVVAAEAEAGEIPVPYRVHEPPAPDRLEELREFLTSVGHALPAKKVRPRDLQAVLDRVKDRPEEQLVSTVLLRSMNRARYDPANLGHFGLASKAYLHFTSPIRRYPDLVVHRVVARVFVDGSPPPDGWAEELDAVCEQASDREQKAQRAERDSIEMKKIEYMRRHLGEEFEGTIASVVPFGFFVLLDQVFVEGLVHVSSLDDDYYTFVPEAYALVGERRRKRFRLGDRVRVQVARADKEERQIDFLLRDDAGARAGVLPSGKPAKARARRGKRGDGR